MEKGGICARNVPFSGKAISKGNQIHLQTQGVPGWGGIWELERQTPGGGGGRGI